MSKEFDKVIEKIKKESGVVIFNAGENPDLITPKYYPTGITALDEVLGGGVPMGCVTSVHGSPWSGKTSLALTLAARLSKEKKRVIYVNLEEIKLNTFADIIGIDLNYVTEINPLESAEEVLRAVEEIIYDYNTNKPKDFVDLIIIDSVNNLFTATEKAAMKANKGSVQMSRRAALLNDWLIRLHGLGMMRNGLMVMCIVQDRANIAGAGMPMAAKTVMSGGESLKFNSKVVLKIKRGKPTRQKNKVVGHEVMFEVVKNSRKGELGNGSYSVIYGIGLDDSRKLFDTAIMPEWGYIISEKRGYYTIILPGLGDIEVKGVDNCIEIIKLYPEVAECLRNLIAGPKPTDVPIKNGFEYRLEEDEIPAEENQVNE